MRLKDEEKSWTCGHLESKARGEYIRKKSAYCIIQQLILEASFRSYVKTGNFV